MLMDIVMIWSLSVFVSIQSRQTAADIQTWITRLCRPPSPVWAHSHTSAQSSTFLFHQNCCRSFKVRVYWLYVCYWVYNFKHNFISGDPISLLLWFSESLEKALSNGIYSLKFLIGPKFDISPTYSPCFFPEIESKNYIRIENSI